MNIAGISGMIMAVALGSGCKSKVDSGTAPLTSAAAAASGAPKKLFEVGKRKWFVATGPRLAIVAGKGVGPIRLGASTETVERHMDLACQDLDEAVCRYVSRAVEFRLTDGQVSQVHVHRAYRAAGVDRSKKPRQYGIFNGALPPDLTLGMLKTEVEKELPKPTKVEKVEDDRGFGTFEVHHHPGMRLEFDAYEGKNVLGGVIITR